ncbi:hypothetical protein MPTK1_8g02615 [Marchantia polymorpha subsp. ruderalis]|uniref:Uncharacterized protein n=1 Tax=Marchantia polymorpha TaxID=3197 RepID=A0A2R6XJ57_MARPO|nr:hypothetical protein MARPO_0012s0054 [Marchantia polymorpha]BBN18449.1 hypothetical protein Mp_8g02570 [Marchantia polymorpha subsp. ruderalis]BBN18452.1 hypothetical protein Mp_8g02600 [Marchantia polymorpha subsp. ruderalis]|eukprot:PTQ46096.1 hypothetical protein MARPO_0012s0054 [Marchantia polymorpha]
MGDEINPAGANETTVEGYTLLHKAAAQGNEDEVLKILAVGKEKIDVATSCGHTALHFAAYGGHETIVTSLLHWYRKNSAADVNARDKVLRRTALHYAVGGGHQRVVEKLLKFPNIDKCPEDSVQNLTPLLMEVMKPKGICKLVMVKTLIAQCPDQINRAVGPDPDAKLNVLPWDSEYPIKFFPSDIVLQKVSGGPRQEQPVQYPAVYLEIEEKAREKDGSLSEGDWEGKKTEDRQKLETESKEQDTQSKCISTTKVFSNTSNRDPKAGRVIDRYLTNECSMAGHTIFHLAATQDNAEVLSHLLSFKPPPYPSANRPSADVNILTAHGGGMTPLHCAIRAESMETFDILMSHREVDVNAVLKSAVDLARPQWTDLTLYSWWTQTKSERFRFYKATCVCDTPLHLAIRCCSSLTLRGMVMKLCNHSRFQPSIYNECGVLPLDLAWLRSSCSLQFGNSSVHLQSVLDVLERQPGNEPLMNEVNSMKHGAQNSVNAVLVAAALLGGVTFNALLQPPFNTELYRKRAVHFFWTFNCMSFYFSMYTILSCLGTTITTQQHTQRFTGGPTNTTSTGLRVFFAHEQAQLVVPLIFCVVTGVGAFVGAGYGNLHQDTRTLMTVCTILGLLLVFIQAARRIFYTFKLYRDVKVGVKNRDDHLWYLVKGVFIEAPRKLICMPCNNRGISHEIPLDQNDFSRDRKLTLLVIHVWAIVVMTIYASVS